MPIDYGPRWPRSHFQLGVALFSLPLGARICESSILTISRPISESSITATTGSERSLQNGVGWRTQLFLRFGFFALTGISSTMHVPRGYSGGRCDEPNARLAVMGGHGWSPAEPQMASILASFDRIFCLCCDGNERRQLRIASELAFHLALLLGILRLFPPFGLWRPRDPKL